MTATSHAPWWPVAILVGGGLIMAATLARLMLGHFNGRMFLIGGLGMFISWLGIRRGTQEEKAFKEEQQKKEQRQ